LVDVVITGLGSVSSMGLDTPRFRASLEAGRPGIRALAGEYPEGLKVKIGAQVENFRPEAHFPASELPLLDRHSQFAVVAAREAVADAGLNDGQIRRAAAVIGSGCGGKETDEITYQQLYREGRKRAHPLTIPRGMPSAASSQVSMYLGIAGPVFTVASACSSANHAVIQAAMMIRAGLVDVAVAGGADAPFTYGLLKAWEAVRVLSNDTCRPFSSDPARRRHHQSRSLPAASAAGDVSRYRRLQLRHFHNRGDGSALVRCLSVGHLRQRFPLRGEVSLSIGPAVGDRLLIYDQSESFLA